MKLYPSWRTNLSVFALIIVVVGGYFFRQTQQASRELQNHAQDHSEILAAVVELNIQNALLSQSGLEETVAASLENSARFIHYLDLIEPFSSVELTAFAAESGFAGVRIVQADNGAAVSGPAGWLQERTCSESVGLERLDDEQLYLFSYLPTAETSATSQGSCVLVGLSAQAIDETLDKISVERLLTMFTDLYDVAYVSFESGNGEAMMSGDIVETVISSGGRQLFVALKTDRFGKRRKQMHKEFIIFISFLVIFGTFSSWWLYRVQRQRLRQAREFERKMARQHEDAALGRAAATITHELRNPLNAIGMGLQRLQIENANLGQDHNKLLISMRSAVERSNTIITRLRQSIHSFEITNETVGLYGILSQVVTLYRIQCEQQQIDVEFNCDRNVSILGDKVLLEQLFENLLKNSVEAQPHGGFLKVSIHSFEQEGKCQVEIVNGGFSLTREESKLLFEPYFTSKTKGTGLGLVISNRIVQAHNGVLKWDADFTRGSIRFVISLPTP